MTKSVEHDKLAVRNSPSKLLQRDAIEFGEWMSHAVSRRLQRTDTFTCVRPRPPDGVLRRKGRPCKRTRSGAESARTRSATWWGN